MKLFGLSVLLLNVVAALNGSLFAFAATEAALQPISLDELKKEFPAINHPHLLQGRFQQVKQLKEIDVEIKTSGQYQIKRVNSDQTAILWIVEKPDPTRICIQEKSLQIVDVKTKKITQIGQDEMAASDSGGLAKLVDLIKLNPTKLHQNFNLSRQGGRLLVKPKSPQANMFKQAWIELDANKHLKNLEITEASGDLLTLQLSGTLQTKLTQKQIQTEGCL